MIGHYVPGHHVPPPPAVFHPPAGSLNGSEKERTKRAGFVSNPYRANDRAKPVHCLSSQWQAPLPESSTRPLGAERNRQL